MLYLPNFKIPFFLVCSPQRMSKGVLSAELWLPTACPLEGRRLHMCVSLCVCEPQGRKLLLYRGCLVLSLWRGLFSLAGIRFFQRDVTDWEWGRGWRVAHLWSEGSSASCQVPFTVLQGEGVEFLGRAADALIAISNYRLHIKFKDSVINVSFPHHS